MSGSNSFAPGSVAVPSEGVGFTVHSMPTPKVGEAQRTRLGRLKMSLVLLVCMAPVIASYVTYFVIRPEGRTNYSDLILPARPLPALPLADLQGKPVLPSTLKGQWLLIVVAGGACDAGCEKLLYLQRQLREMLGKERDRVDKVWFISDQQRARPEVLTAISLGAPAIVLQVPRDALTQWLAPAAGKTLEQHLYVVDPMGNWMMRAPPDPEPAKLKRDLETLLRASAFWDGAG
jgi:hypothetical protein